MMAMLLVARPVALVAGLLLAGNAAAIADCAGLIDQFNTALQVRDLPEVKSIEARIAVDAACGGRLIEIQRRRAALQLLVAQQQQGSPSQYEMLVVDADKPDVLWQAAFMLGDVRFSQRRFAEATLAYERAIETIKNLSKTPSSPPTSAIKQAFDRASEARMLAANEESPSGQASYVAVAKDHRSGAIGGALSPDIRGFKPQAVLLPIRFITASAKFSPLGEQAAQELVATLKEQQPAEVRLVGHTDERGAADYNLKLSQQRARALAGYLAANGIAAKITTDGKGKSEPLQLSNTAGLTKQDIWSLNRRVVLVRK
jgi:outer membrane protein OmpA-like peptidoglycan-associated protein